MYTRTALLYGDGAVEKFKSSRVAVFGLGGVGGYVVEALARSGIGSIDIIDNDAISVTNINRQIIATAETVGEYKTGIMEKRIISINPECKVKAYKTFVLPENIDEFVFFRYNYVVDAIDTVSGKLAIVKKAYNENIPVISAMGAGNKLDPTGFEVADIYETSVCPLAKVMRKLCRENGINKLKVVYSKEAPSAPRTTADSEEANGKRQAPGSSIICPAAMGIIIASEVLKDLS